MVRSVPAALMMCVFTFIGASLHSRQDKPNVPAKPPEIMPRRPECGILLPERGERYDMARLIRADQFLDCERDGFPKHLSPPWTETAEAETSIEADDTSATAAEWAWQSPWVRSSSFS